jgi:hypothetical protein
MRGTTTVMDIRSCPFCAEPIGLHAGKCAYCGESLSPPTRESVLRDQSDAAEAFLDQVDSVTLSYLRGAELRGAYLSGVDLFHADLAAADLRGADLGAANLSEADLSGADLGGANLVGADLSGADLCGADLCMANLTLADLNGAVYNQATSWPDDFDPQSAGAILARTPSG